MDVIFLEPPVMNQPAHILLNGQPAWSSPVQRLTHVDGNRWEAVTQSGNVYTGDIMHPAGQVTTVAPATVPAAPQIGPRVVNKHELVLGVNRTVVAIILIIVLLILSVSVLRTWLFFHYTRQLMNDTTREMERSFQRARDSFSYGPVAPTPPTGLAPPPPPDPNGYPTQ